MAHKELFFKIRFYGQDDTLSEVQLVRLPMNMGDARPSSERLREHVYTESPETRDYSLQHLPRREFRKEANVARIDNIMQRMTGLMLQRAVFVDQKN